MVVNHKKTFYTKKMSQDKKFDWKNIFNESSEGDLINIVDPATLSPEDRYDLIDGLLKDYQISILMDNKEIENKYKEIVSQLIRYYGH
tara:strand:+ start:691 stop:954 length:264 start_codon:yes stop_codon:yes gene_type:complete